MVWTFLRVGTIPQKGVVRASRTFRRHEIDPYVSGEVVDHDKRIFVASIVGVLNGPVRSMLTDWPGCVVYLRAFARDEVHRLQ